MRTIILGVILTAVSACSACGGTLGNIDSGSAGNAGSGGAAGDTTVIVLDSGQVIDDLTRLQILAKYITESCEPNYRIVIADCDKVARANPDAEQLIGDCAELNDLYFELKSSQLAIGAIDGNVSGYTLSAMVAQLNLDIQAFNDLVIIVQEDLNGY